MLTEFELEKLESIKSKSDSLLEFKMHFMMDVISRELSPDGKSEFEYFYSYQKKIISSVNEVLDSSKTCYKQLAVAGANGVGKSHLLMALVTYLAYWGWNKRNIKIITLSGKFDQLMNVLFKKVKDCVRTMDGYKSNNKSSTDSITSVTNDKINNYINRTFTAALSWDASEPEKIKGIHADQGGIVIVMLDECTAIPDVIIENIRTTVAGSSGILIATANPHTKNNSFYRFFNSSITESYYFGIPDLPDRDQVRFQPFVNSVRETYGENSYQFYTQVLARFSDENKLAMFPTKWIDEAMARTSRGTSYEPYHLGVDVAGGLLKGDFSVICVRQGSTLVEVMKTHQELPEFKQTIMRYIHKYSYNDRYGRTLSPVTGIDACGIGLAIVQELERYPGLRIMRIVGSGKGDEAFFNFRLILYNRLKEWLQFANLADFKYIDPRGSDVTGGYISNLQAQQELRAQLEEVEMVDELRHGESTGRFKLDKKQKMHTISPDLLDALSYTFVADESDGVIDPLAPQLTPSVQTWSPEANYYG